MDALQKNGIMGNGKLKFTKITFLTSSWITVGLAKESRGLFQPLTSVVVLQKYHCLNITIQEQGKGGEGYPILLPLAVFI